MNPQTKLLDVVSLKRDVPEDQLTIGEVGAIVEVLDEDCFLVEFNNPEGHTSAMLELTSEDFDCALASESALSKDWLRPEEDEAWKDL